MERFTVEVPEATLGDLAERLARARWPGALNGSGWEDGTSPAFLRELVGWWQTGFDWRAHEAAINRYAHFRATVDGVGAAPRVAELWAELMTDVLGYERFGAHGGDIGAMVANRLALEHPERLAGIHVTGTADPYVGPGAAPLTPGEQAMLSARAHWHEVEGGYVHLQRTRPQTLAYGLADSPVGLAAWILEKWRAWSDGDLERRFTKDQLITTVMLFWATGTISSSFRFHRDWALGAASLPEALAVALADRTEVPAGVVRPLGRGERIGVPAAVALFDYRCPREWAERAYSEW
jgi:pimeloyl-ACP methyl ester carboxylesterase